MSADDIFEAAINQAREQNGDVNDSVRRAQALYAMNKILDRLIANNSKNPRGVDAALEQHAVIVKSLARNTDTAIDHAQRNGMLQVQNVKVNLPPVAIGELATLSILAQVGLYALIERTLEGRILD